MIMIMIKNGVSDIRDIKRRIMACLWNLGSSHPRSLKMTRFSRPYTIFC